MNFDKAPYKKLWSLPLRDISIQDEFWEPRIRTNGDITLPLQYKHLEGTGCINNFLRASGRADIAYRISGVPGGTDSDLYKWLEAASYSLGTHPDQELQAKVDNAVSEIAHAQEKDGYLNTYFMFERKGERWTEPWNHELYCAGHLFEAAVAHHYATGQKSLLEVAIRFADCICNVFGPGKKPGGPGHEEVELALVKLYRETGHKRYLDLARFFIDQRGRGLSSGNKDNKDNQDHVPFLQQEEIVGHAVCAMYLMCGAASVYSETGEQALFDTLDRLWHDMVEKKVYITGGIGAHYRGEEFGKNYELPNSLAYAETCAAIGNIFWNYRMLQLTGNACYADVMETVLYNGFLSGLSLDGRKYFYVNPLRDDGTHRRQEWFPCACCPPNIARLLASLGGYFYGISNEGIWVHLYATSTAKVLLEGDRKITLNLQTSYPWDGDIEIVISADAEITFTLFLRIPAWCSGATAAVNRNPVEVEEKGGYISINRRWKDKDQVNLNLPMPVRLMECHPHSNNTGRLAICRGPLVYCIEAVDHPGIDLFDIELLPELKLNPSFEPTLLGGVTVISGEAKVSDRSDWQGKLYQVHGRDNKTKLRRVGLTAVPYPAWANREAGKMEVWIPWA